MRRQGSAKHSSAELLLPLLETKQVQYRHGRTIPSSARQRVDSSMVPQSGPNPLEEEGSKIKSSPLEGF
jgi:hypothetical protein